MGGGGGGGGMGMVGGGAAALGMFNKELGNQFNLLGSLLGDQNDRVHYPEVSGPEKRYRRRTNQLLGESRTTLEDAYRLRSDMLVPYLQELGYDFDLVDNREALAAEEEKLARLKADAAQVRKNLRKSGSGGKGSTKLAKLRNKIDQQTKLVGEMRSQPVSIGNIRKAAPTAEEQANNDIQERLANRVLQALDGEIPDDPRLMRELEKQERVLREKLLRQLGTGYETSSGGIEALSDFNQRKAELLAETQRKELYGSRGLQLQGDTVMENIASGRRNEALTGVTGQSLFGNLFAENAMANVRAQQPFQFDREMMLKVALANQGIPTGAAATFGALSNYANTKGDNLYQFAGAMGAASQGGGGGGGGGGGMGGMLGGLMG